MIICFPTLRDIHDAPYQWRSASSSSIFLDPGNGRSFYFRMLSEDMIPVTDVPDVNRQPFSLQLATAINSHLFEQALQNLDELTLVITSSSLRMSDEERLQSIDRLYGDTNDKLSFLRSFNRKADDILRHRQVMQSQRTQPIKIRPLSCTA